ncbi:hypothetical protein [Comamonas avium]|uniref:Uncharacterized protein n=1 Tax=Comamonas avium TaxID=2762231 RepID=A0ABR8S781_9BURK|nr:hypothetical protein [Comamonas avium]MBD7959350.1 hypothetical protein [Comamonas avium]
MSNPITLTAPSNWSADKRLQLHAVFNAWISSCSEEEYLHLMSLREQVAPGQVCSIVTLVRSYFERPSLSLPASLIQLMQARNLQPVSAGASSAAG